MPQLQNVEECVVYKNQFPHNRETSRLGEKEEKIKDWPYWYIPETEPAPGTVSSSELREQEQDRKSRGAWETSEEKKPVPDFLCVTWKKKSNSKEFQHLP